jgi:hypothetical protein
MGDWYVQKQFVRLGKVGQGWAGKIEVSRSFDRDRVEQRVQLSLLTEALGMYVLASVKTPSLCWTAFLQRLHYVYWNCTSGCAQCTIAPSWWDAAYRRVC